MCSAWRNKRLRKIIGVEMHQAHILHQTSGKAARIFVEFSYQTRKSWPYARRVVAKAEYLDKGENPRFVVTSSPAQQWAAQGLYEKFYCARGEMENRIREQTCLFASGSPPKAAYAPSSFRIASAIAFAWRCIASSFSASIITRARGSVPL